MATSPLFLWNASDALVWAILGVKSFTLLPYAFLNLLIPLFSVFYAYRGYTLKKPE
jgi:NhaC family Na+:H+ antiporter